MTRDVQEFPSPELEPDPAAPGCECFPADSAEVNRRGVAASSCACRELQRVARRERWLSRRDVLVALAFVVLGVTVVVALWR